jgi:hypothetical protein
MSQELYKQEHQTLEPISLMVKRCRRQFEIQRIIFFETDSILESD